jgi:hypothetical protein
MTHWRKSEVPHWLIGGINVALVAVAWITLGVCIGLMGLAFLLRRA